MRMCLPVLCLALAGPVSAGVIVVDPRGGDGSALLEASLASAQDGDVLLVRAGEYDAPPGGPAVYQIPDRSLVLVADDGGARIALPSLVVSGLSAGRQVVVRGFQIGTGSAVPLGEPAIVTGCSGVVRFEDCGFVGTPGFALPNPFVPESFLYFAGQAALELDDCHAIQLERCALAGGHGLDLGAPIATAVTDGGPGLLVRDCRVTIAGCTLSGGAAGATAGGANTHRGGDGLLVDGVAGSGHVFLLGGSAVGGAGGSSGSGSGGPGGNGWRSLDPWAVLWQRGAVVTGGAGGGGAPAGAAGASLDVPAGALTVLSAPWASVVAPAPLREGQGASLVLAGAPGDLALLLFSPSAGWWPLAGAQGALLVSPAGMLGPLGVAVLGAGGTASIPFTMPPLSAVEGLPIFVQLVTKGGAAAAVGGATTLVWLDSAF